MRSRESCNFQLLRQYLMGVLTLTAVIAVTVVNSVNSVNLQTLQRELQTLQQKPWIFSHF